MFERNARGKRCSPLIDLTEREIEEIKLQILSIDADLDVFVFNDARYFGTGYSDKYDKIVVKRNVYPDLSSGSNVPRDIMSVRAVLAH